MDPVRRPSAGGDSRSGLGNFRCCQTKVELLDMRVCLRMVIVSTIVELNPSEIDQVSGQSTILTGGIAR